MAPQEDPIFPADKALWDHDVPLYFDSSQRFNILGCADYTDICDPETKECFSLKGMRIVNSTLDRQDEESQLALSLLSLGLVDAGIASSLKNRRGIGLDAQSKIIGFTSLPLGRDQWKVEVRKMFQTSLARLQGEIMDIARGSGANVPGYMNLLKSKDVRICRIVKIPTVGWKNISLVWLILLPAFALFLWVFSLEMGSSILLVWLFVSIVHPTFRYLWYHCRRLSSTLAALSGRLIRRSGVVESWNDVCQRIPKLWQRHP